MVGQLFEGCGKFLQGFSSTLGFCCQLTAMHGGKVLVSKTALQGLKGYLIGCAFWDSM
jgi:hypothetical protein